MGKPYSHCYHFAGSGSSAGAMICAHCHQPIFNHAHDWLSYKKDTGGDWGYVTFHRKCREDQSGWTKIEAAQKAEKDKRESVMKAICLVCKTFGVSREYIVDLMEDDQ